MKARLFLMALFTVMTVIFISANDNIQRDYWPTSDWHLSKPEIQGMDSGKLKEMTEYIQENLPLTSSIVVVRHGYIVFEQSYLGESGDSRNLYSATKSVLSALLGIALEEGYIRSIDQKMIDYFPEYANEKLAAEANTITLRHLLTLSDGIANLDFEYSFSNTTLSRPLKNKPGTVFFYNNMSPQILSIIITKTTGLMALDFAKKYLFTPLGISNIQWYEISGANIGAFGMWLTSRDMAKIGYLFLNKGYWDGEKILTSEWVTESTSAQIQVPMIPYFSEQFDYGFLWWIHSIGGHEAFSAIGYGGQYITVIPDFDIVVVITTDEQSHSNASTYLSLINSYVLASIKN